MSSPGAGVPAGSPAARAGDGAAPPARVPGGARPSAPPTRGALSWGVRGVLALAAVLTVAGLFAVWANRQLLDNGAWTRTSTKLLENRAVQAQLSTYLTEQLYANVDVAGELRSGLPKQLKPLAGPAAGGLRTVVEEAIGVALRTSQVQGLWRTASETAHRELVAVIENRHSVVRTPGGGRVVLDLRPIVASVAERLGTPASVVERIRHGSIGEVTLARSQTLETMQGAVRGLRDLALVLPLLALALFALAVALSRGRRSRALVVVGVVTIAAALASLIARSLIGTRVVDALASTEALRPAASATWSIATSLLVDLSVALIAIGALVVLAGMLAGRSRWARGTRRALAPYLRDRPELAFAAAAVALLLIFLWGPIAATQKVIGIAVITVLVLAGVEALRRQTAAEFPDARYRAERDGLRGRVDGARELIPRRRTRELERLAALHARGALTDEEFAAEKRRVLGGPTRPSPGPPAPGA